MRAIHYAPRAPLSLLLRRPSSSMDEALSLAPTFFHFSRDALHAWFGRRAGTILFPSFHCGMEVRAAVDAGCAVAFYRVREDCTIDEADLAARLEGAAAVVVIHYFGFPQPGIARLAALCRERGVALIEDCSHAFLSRVDGKPLGTFGDAATFSLYKSLGTVDGGALRDGDTRCSARAPFAAIDAHLAAWKKRWRDRAEEDIAVLRARFEERVIAARQRIFDAAWSYGGGMSRLSLALTRRVDPSLVIERRRANYRRLAALLGIDDIPISDASGKVERGWAGSPHHTRGSSDYALAEGTVPLFLPYFVADRVEALTRLQARRIEPFIFGMFHHPAMTESEFTEARRLRENLLCLPVHHQLTDRDLQRIAEVLR